MNKKDITLISITLPILYFLVLWFFDYLTSRLFVFIFIIIPVIYIFILFILQLIFLIINLMAIPKNKIHIVYTSILLLSLILPFIISYRKAKVELELILFKKQRDEIIESIQNNEFQYGYEGNIKLPIYNYTSNDGEIYVYQNDEEGTLISFWIVRGMLSGSIELMYSSKGEDLIRNNETEHPIIKIDKLKENWYYVETDY